MSSYMSFPLTLVDNLMFKSRSLPPDSLNSKKKMKQAWETQNPLICPLIEEYISSRSEIEREGSSPFLHRWPN